jgi:predicted transcriptional regulator
MQTSNETEWLPPQVQRLAPCEREVATLVYCNGPMTVQMLEAQIQREITNSTLRTTLARLCRKKILKRRKIFGVTSRSRRRVPYIYSPAISLEAVRARVLIEVARNFFDGSLPRMAEEVSALCDSHAASATSGHRKSSIAA